VNENQVMSNDLDLLKLFKFLRVVDVVDAMDGLGYFNTGLMHSDVRPIWLGMKFWGAALTVRCVPANRPMWPLNTTDEIVNAHEIWFEKMGYKGFDHLIQPGHVVVTDTGGAKEVGFWGSNNSLGAVSKGAVGIITDGFCRDTGEIALQRTPVCARARGRTIIPGRIEVVDVQVKIGCGGVQVAPNDIVGCDDDGIVVVPQDIAADVAYQARAILLADMYGRAKLYAQLGMEPDETIDYIKVEVYYDQLGKDE
jgi:4-hydroxy-4-methyl-2-oxoglutarate aldolase